MEQKTAEEILRDKQIEYNNSIGKSENNMTDEEWKETLADPVFQSLVNAMQAYAKQQQEIAVEKALEMCANLSKEMIYDRDKLTKEESKGLILRNFQVCYATSKQEILSLKPEILKELEK